MKQSFIITTTTKRITVKEMAEVRNLLPDESNHLLEKNKIKDLKDFSVEERSHSFNGVKIITNSSENQVLLQSSKEYLQDTWIPKFSLKIYPMLNFEVFRCGVKCSISALLSNRANILNRWLIVDEAIRYLNLLEIIHKKEITHEQILAMGLIYLGEKKYKLETLTRAFEYFALPQSAYSRMRKDYELP